MAYSLILARNRPISALASEGEGRTFESCLVLQSFQCIRSVSGKRGGTVGLAAFFACSGSTRCDSLRMCRSPLPFLG
jgi:hypothetical protein